MVPERPRAAIFFRPGAKSRSIVAGLIRWSLRRVSASRVISLFVSLEHRDHLGQDRLGQDRRQALAAQAVWNRPDRAQLRANLLGVDPGPFAPLAQCELPDALTAPRKADALSLKLEESHRIEAVVARHGYELIENAPLFPSSWPGGSAWPRPRMTARRSIMVNLTLASFPHRGRGAISLRFIT